MLLKERASGMYRLSAFYFARTASDLPMDMAIPTLFLLLVYFMGGLHYSASAFFANFFTVILVMLVRQCDPAVLDNTALHCRLPFCVFAVMLTKWPSGLASALVFSSIYRTETGISIGLCVICSWCLYVMCMQLTVFEVCTVT